MVRETDFLLNKENDLTFLNGDLRIGKSETQEVVSILTSSQGWYKRSPLVGADLLQFLKGKRKQTEIDRRVKIQLILDGKNYGEVKEMILMNLKIK